ncbi:hypothetical protein [Salipiger thiooxidans]|uniref:hypothetical protein n=1 Tax=Salipiger thiooxidans TaxID=282683 RepID=UPI001CD7E43E|nr:hypothetical protein [Salipiger thiooxidans]MCA0849374.1 hypothetical protein [Salipiger thiooxidans]
MTELWRPLIAVQLVGLAVLPIELIRSTGACSFGPLPVVLQVNGPKGGWIR